jgi:hypothetical protein
MLNPLRWLKFLLAGLALIVAGGLGGLGGVLIVGVAIAAYVAIRMGVREGWKKSPVAVALIVLGAVFMVLFYVHFNGLTCTLKGGLVINLGTDNSICVGPS